MVLREWLLYLFDAESVLVVTAVAMPLLYAWVPARKVRVVCCWPDGDSSPAVGRRGRDGGEGI
jgi:hypothetical protein